jgi:2-oxo-4-hydroxy-4-carboxy-5-ureidoimidazoline decarboxylase
MTIQQLNNLDQTQLTNELEKCCGAQNWIQKMLTQFPISDEEALFQIAEEKWAECSEEDWLEAFEHHPKIGDVDALKKKFASTATWASNEQSGVQTATEEIIAALAQGNTDYEEKFGFIFIVCATGKSASEMLELLKVRLNHDRAQELHIAAAEQAKITQLRLKKLLS